MEKIYESLISIPEKIAILAKEKPDDSAIIASDRILTYRNLDEISNRVAYAIISMCPDLKEESTIGLLLDRKSYVFPWRLELCEQDLHTFQ